MLSHEAAEEEPTSRGLYDSLTAYKNTALLHVVADVLNVVNHLQRILQYRDISFSCIRSQVCTNVILSENKVSKFFWEAHCNKFTFGYF